MNDKTTLPRRFHFGALPIAIAEHARAQAKITEEATGGEFSRHVAALNTVADDIAGKREDDLRIYALGQIMGQFGEANHYNPGERQDLLFALLGSRGPAPLPDATLDELVGAAVDDLITRHDERVAQFARERDQAIAKATEVEATRERAEAAESQLQTLTDERDTANASLAELGEQLRHMRTMLQAENGRGAKASKPRRIRVPDHTGVYCRPTTDGELPPESERVYEIGWMEGGKQSWKVIGPDLDEAIAARAALTEAVAA